jgi:hypothetical protein
MRVLNSICFIILLFCATSSLNGQVDEPTPVSPQIAAFQQHGDINVNLSTGVPNISVPLLEINHFGYKLPISLDYFPTPLRPGYNYDVTGVGWNLSLRSHISRKVNFLPDEYSNFEVYEIPYGLSNTQQVQLFSTFHEHNLASDVFNATLPDGSSFEFMIVNNANSIEVIVLNGRPIKITWDEQISIISFEVTDESGIIYTFGQPNNSTRTDHYLSEWHLTEIKLPQNDTPIVFYYDNIVRATHYYPIGGYAYAGIDGDNNYYQTSTGNARTPFEHDLLLLTGINYGAGEVSFKYENDMPNLAALPINGTFYNYLEEIKHKENGGHAMELWNGNTENIDHITFTTNKDTVNGIPIAQLEAIEFKERYNAGTPITVKKYNFENDDINIHGNNTDNWGYLNNSLGSLNGVSNFVFYSNIDFDNISFGHGEDPAYPHDLSKLADEQSNQYAKYQFNKFKPNAGKPGGDHGLLNAIIYPTGGRTEFDFERHKFLTQTSEGGEFIEDLKNREVAEASGFRIQTITNKDTNGDITGKKSYRYGKRASEIWDTSNMWDPSIDGFMIGKHPEAHTNVGEVTVDPTIVNFIQYKVKFYYSLVSTYVPPELIVMNYLNVILGRRYTPIIQNGIVCNVSISANNFQRLLNGRPQVVYPYVTIYNGEYDDTDPTSTDGINGKTEHVFDFMEEDENGVERFIEPVQGKSLEYVSGGSEFDSKYGFYFPSPYRYNKLLEKRDYSVKNSEYVLVKKEANEWANSSWFIGDLYNTFHGPYPERNIEITIASDELLGETPIDQYVNQGLRSVYTEHGGDRQLAATTSTVFYDDGSELVSRRRWNYLPGSRLSSEYVYNSGEKTSLKEYRYPYAENTEFADLAAKNIINVPTSIRTFYDDKFTSGVQTRYDSDGRPINVYIAEHKGDDILYNSNIPYTYPLKYSYNYNTDGKINEMIDEDSYTTVYLWDASNSYVMAKIENTNYATVSSLDGKDHSYDSKTLYSELQALVGNNALITTYTYDAITGLDNTTDPKGYSTYYLYDNFNRLKSVHDQDGNILSANEYNYKPQN